MEGQRAPAVLVVDDEPVVRNLVRLALSEVGYTVLDAAGAAEAIALCASLGDQALDLLIIDHGLAPEISRMVAESIAPFSPSMKVLVTSGWSYQEVNAEEGFPPGSSFLKKPFTAQQLLSLVQNVLFPGTQ